MKTNYETKAGVFILRLEGDLIGETGGAGILGKVIEGIEMGLRTCIIDISNLRYINSSGLGLLITILTKFRNKDGEVYLMRPSESVQKLLVITKLNAIFQIINSEEEVKASKSPK